MRPGVAPAADGEGGEAAGDGTGVRLVTLDEIRDAASRLRGVARRTPLLAVPLRADRPEGPNVWLKCENLQHVSAFKVRGAYNFVALLDEERRRAGLVTFSSGNHAQGVAFAARAFGVPATIVMPEDVPRVKLEGTKALGARVELAGTTTVERQERAEAIVRETGAAMVPPFDHPHIIAGQGTVGLEILEDLVEATEGEEPDAASTPALVLVPIGGGGLISGISAALKEMDPEVRVVGVEPVGAASMHASVEAGRPVTIDRPETIADGLKPVRPGDWTFHHVRELVDEIVLVEDEDIRRGVRWCFDRRLVVEPSGAATAAALLSGRVAHAAEGATVAVVSGGNVDPALYADLVGD